MTIRGATSKRDEATPSAPPTMLAPPAKRAWSPHVAVGLVVQAVTTYLTLIIAGRILGAAEFGGVGALYILLSSVATGLFVPLEQEIARRRGREWDGRPVDGTLLRRATLFATGLCVIVAAMALGLFDATVRLLGEHPQLLAAFCVAMPGYALCFISRGTLSGGRRLARYGVQLSAEGVFRLVGLAVLALLGVNSADAFGWLFGLAPWVALGCSLIAFRAQPATSQDTSPHPLVRPLLLLLAGSLAAQLLIGAGPVMAQLFATDDNQARAGAFLAALVVVRVPIFLFTAVQPSMLPTMSAHAAAGRKQAFKAVLSKVFVMMGLLALVTTVGTAVLGPWGLTFLFGPDYVLSWVIFLLMGVSVGLFLTASVLAQAVLALGDHVHVAAVWAAGLVGLTAGTFLVHDTVMRATLGLLVGAAVAAATAAGMLWLDMRRWQEATG